MNKISFFKNYLNIYMWQIVALLLHFLSLIIVLPFITDNKPVFGIYSVCISISIFLNYADLGFVKAALKYGGEYFVTKRFEDEKKMYGFSSFILFLVISLISLIFIFFSFNPNLLINDINLEEHIIIASRLLIIQAIFSYNIVPLKYLDCIFQVRVEQYILQRYRILGNALKILSVYYFFHITTYDIIGYYLFTKIIDLGVLVIGFVIVNKRYDFSFFDFLNNFRFSSEVFKKSKKLAFNSLYVTFCFILYYELDVFFIGKYFGVEEVAVFSLALFFLQFLRSLSSIVLSPFQSRYNHFVGLENYDGLRNFLKNIFKVTMPFFIFTGILIMIYSKEIILTWSGQSYVDSVFILELFSMVFLLNFIITPGSNLLVSLLRIKDIYLINTVVVFVFWLGIFFSYKLIGIISFPLFKLFSSIIFAMFYFKVVLNFLKQDYFKSIFLIIKRLFIPVFSIFLLHYFVKDYLPLQKSSTNFIIILIIMFISFKLALISLYFTSNSYKILYTSYINKLKKLKHE
jgi:O-antigen/teichoic acid export membrane protein